MKRQMGLIAVLVLIATFVFGGAGTVGAAGTVVVTPTNTQGWSTADTRPGGTVTFVNADAPPGGGAGSLQLTTNATTAAKAQYLHAANTPLSAVTTLSYYTKQVSASFPQGDPAYQLIVCLTGAPTSTTCPGFTTLVFEPYQNTALGPVVPNTWQKWNVAAGLFWSTRTVPCPNGTITGTPGGPATYTLNAIKAACPNAVVAGYGVNIGTYNPSYTVRTDLFTFNGTTYNFELYSVPTEKEQCKNGGWKTFNPPTGPFKNQGACVSYVEHHRTGDKDHHDDGGDGHHGNGGDDNSNGHAKNKD